MMSIFEEYKEHLVGEFESITKEPDTGNDEKVTKVIMVCPGFCAVIALQPIPFADIFVLIPVQAMMVMKIASLKGFEISLERAKEIFLELAGTVGMGLASQQTVLILYKVGLPFFGGVFIVPMVFGLTYAMGKAVAYYFDLRQAGKQADKSVL